MMVGRNVWPRLLAATTLLPLLLLLVACPQQQELLQAFGLTAPDTATADQPFSLTVTAVGNQGTSPFTGFSGTVDLEVSAGATITPTNLTATQGVATGQVTISGATGAVTMTARAQGATGTATISLSATTLPGDPADPVQGNLPDIPLIPGEEDYSDDHPLLPGIYLSHNTLALLFTPGTTIGEANALLQDHQASIVGGVNGTGDSNGALFLRLPTTTHQEMESALAALRASPFVDTAVQDALLEIPALAVDEVVPPPDPSTRHDQADTARIPQPNGGNPPGWTWEVTPTGGNWGLEQIRAPQLWNLNNALEKIHPNVATMPVTGVLDSGFTTGHPDLNVRNFTPAVTSFHGTHVAGIIHGDFDDGDGVDGVNPFTTLRVGAYFALAGLSPAPGSIFVQRASWGLAMTAGLQELIRRSVAARVVNISLGFNWGPAGVDLTAAGAAPDAARLIASAQGAVTAAVLNGLTDAPLIVATAGNDSTAIPDGSGGFVIQPARWSSPLANAALEHGSGHVLVVESTDISLARSGFSNTGGHVSAPGSQILSTSIPHNHPAPGGGTINHPGNYSTESGTSMAAPLVTGLIGYLYAIDGSLSQDEIRTLVTGPRTTRSVSGGASSQIDAFAAALDIDFIQGGDRVLRMLLDIDDGTLDGNQRRLIGTASSPTDGDGDGLADGAVGDDQKMAFLASDFTGEDADGDGGRGDGRVDMADFRRWRDLLLQTEANARLRLDGTAGNPKRDPNGNGTSSETAATENVYPQGDFNGDGRLDRSATRFVPGAVDASATDLQVLRQLFADPHYDIADLDGLIDSADLTAWPKSCFDLDGFAVTEVTASIRPQGSEPEAATDTRSHGSKNEAHIFTLPTSGSFTVRFEAKEADGTVVGVFEADLPGDLPLELGGDVLLDDCDPKPVIDGASALQTTIPADTDIEQTFFLDWKDAGENLFLLRNTFTLLPEDIGGVFETETGNPDFAANFDGASGRGEYKVFIFVSCDFDGNPTLKEEFVLVDENEQESETATLELTVDYSACDTQTPAATPLGATQEFHRR